MDIGLEVIYEREKPLLNTHAIFLAKSKKSEKNLKNCRVQKLV